MIETSQEYRLLTEDEVDDPMSEEILAFWRSRCFGNFAPSWCQFALEKLNPRIIPFLTVVDVSVDPQEFVYRFWGTGHSRTKGIDLTGKSVLAHSPPEVGEVIFAEYQRLLETQKPSFFQDRFHHQNKLTPLIQTTTRLPISDDGQSVTKVISYCNLDGNEQDWKMFFDDNIS